MAKKIKQESSELKILDTLSKEYISFNNSNPITVYNCGPTVYWRLQVGNIRAYTNWDILHRSLLYLGYDVKRAMNFTDVGHMSEDMDFGEDKIEKAALKEGKDPKAIADYYIDTILMDFHKLNLLHPDGNPVEESDSHKNSKKHGWLRATDYIADMIKLNKQIEKNGFTYETDQALYLDTSKIANYHELSGQKLDEKLSGVREEVEGMDDKRNPADFVLWMKRKGKYAKHMQHWESPWGDGFPGWHIECSAMGCKVLGTDIDIHTGGVDHISVHHSNERAQNFGAYGKEVVKAWVHNEFVNAKDGEKLSKSKGNANSLDELEEQGYDALDLRYYFGSIKYRQPVSFSFEALDAARTSRLKIYHKINEWVMEILRAGDGTFSGKPIEDLIARFKVALADDLNMSVAFSVLHELLESNAQPIDKVATLIDIDHVLGFSVDDYIDQDLLIGFERFIRIEGCVNARDLKEMRDFTELELNLAEAIIAMIEFKKEKQYEKSDKLRAEIAEQIKSVLSENLGFSVMGEKFMFTLER